MEFKDRLKQIRTERKLSQVKLAELVGVHVTNISRYERGENKPTVQVLTKLGDALGVSGDYLMAGDIEDMANEAINDRELFNQFKKVTELSKEQQYIIKEFLDAFLIKADLQRKLA
jgi:transcriptional regulator with XRE-family HTH domain